MADRIQLMLEAERRGILPENKVALLAEARRRGLVPSTPNAAPQQPAMEPAPSIGGMGGFNPMARFASAANAGLQDLGVTPENSANPIANAAGVGEILPQAATGALATVAGGLAGLGQAAKNLVAPGMDAADRVRQVQEALTYQPRTATGNVASRVVAAPAEALSAATNRAGEFVTDVTGSPALGATVKTVGDITPAVIASRGQVPRVKRTPKEQYTPKPDAAAEVPTTEQLTSAARNAYSKAEESGVMVQPESYTKAVAKVRAMLKREGINQKLHPKSSAVLEELESAQGKALTLQEAETLRKIARDAEDDLNPVTRQPTPDSRLAGKIVDELDETIEALSANSPARELWARSRRSQLIDQMIYRAELRSGANYTQAGMETALRQEFKQLAMNPRRMRGLTKEQKVAIAKVAQGGKMENALRTLGKFDPTTGGVAALASLGTSGMLGAVTGGAGFALPAIGFGAKRLATRATARNVEAAREALVGRGLPNEAPPSTAPTMQSGATAPTSAASQTAPPRATARSAQDVQADIERLTEQAQSVPRSPSGAAQLAAIRLRLALLERELSEQGEAAQVAQ